jgi:hypothetical protein
MLLLLLLLLLLFGVSVGLFFFGSPSLFSKAGFSRFTLIGSLGVLFDRRGRLF